MPGVILTLVVLIAWIRDAKREYDHLPLEHHVPTQETALPEDRQQAAAE